VKQPGTSRPAPYFREAGSGPGVVCVHANASTSSQWRGLMDLLAAKHRVLAPDSYGAGRSSEWQSRRTIALRDEADLIEPVLARAGSPVALVGHSYGAAVALVAAVMHPERVRALAVYEPTLFSLVDAQAPPPNEADGIRAVVDAAGAALDAGNPDAAAEAFIDYWMGEGSWSSMPAERKQPIAGAIVNVRRWAHALLTEPTSLRDFGELEVPVLYMMGRRSPASAHAVARLLVGALPQVRVIEFEELGHMGPITHPDLVNEAIRRFLDSPDRPAGSVE
jgi:pimeloyl-ACP methyl ester carboxylesterase